MKKSLKILLYIGQYRFPLSPHDVGAVILEGLLASGHEICALCLAENDPLSAIAKENHIPVHFLPAELDAPVDRMRQIFSTTKPLPLHLTEWINTLKQYDAEWGLVYCGGWVPPQLRILPSKGFLNLHPGPLPQLTGYDPEKFLILQEAPYGQSTIHYLADKFDTGRILSLSRPVRIPLHTTVPELSYLLSSAGIEKLVELLNDMGEDVPEGFMQNEMQRGYAKRAIGYRACCLDLARETVSSIERKRRVFNSLADGMCLRMALRDGNGFRTIRYAEPLSGSFPGRPGERIGICRKPGFRLDLADVYRLVDGVVILRFGPAISDWNDNFYLSDTELVRPGITENWYKAEDIDLNMMPAAAALHQEAWK